MKNDMQKYEDILYMPHPTSVNHPRMSMMDRAAQFAPFAALTGHKEAVNETARVTEEKRILDENKKAFLDEQLQMILEHIKERPQIKVTYFIPDEVKEGGCYETIEKCIRRIDEVERILQFVDGVKIRIEDIYEIEMCKESIQDEDCE